MSRYYSVVVGAETTDRAGPAGVASGNIGATWTNRVTGPRGPQADLGAQTVEFDLWQTAFDAPAGLSYVRIWGPSKTQISQASDFQGAPIQVYGGMQAGLPLATANSAGGQAGILSSGQIFQAFGNWQGLTQTLDFIVQSLPGTQSTPANIFFLWVAGQPLAQALNVTLKAAFPPPTYSINININSSLIRTQTEIHVCDTLTQFATYIRGISQDTLGGDYGGVAITISNNVITASDGTFNTGAPVPTQILEQDLIGSVTWLDAFTIQFNTVMRADLTVSSQIVLPQIAGLQAITNANSASFARNRNTFSGTWIVNNVRHVGNSRAPGAQSWISNFQAYSQKYAPADVAVSDTSA